MLPPDIRNAEDQERRSREIADTLRRYLVGMNSGAIVVIVGLAGALASNGEKPAWAVAPIAVYVAALLMTLYSLVLAKRKALARRDAYLEQREQPDFKTRLRDRNETWDVCSLLAFIAGAITTLAAIW